MNTPPRNVNAPHWRLLFFQMLRKTGNVSAAARHAGRPRAHLYRMRKQDSDFASQWDDALDEAADWLELEALNMVLVCGFAQARKLM